MRLLLTALVTVLTVTACGSDTTSTPDSGTTAPTVTAPASTPAPTPTALTIAQAAAKYQQIVKPSNDITFGEFGHAEDAYNANPTDTTRAALNTAAKHLAVALRTMAQKFRSTPWPPEAQSAMADLTKADASQIAGANTLSAAKTDADVQSAMTLFDDKAVAQSSELVRESLGLPPAPTS